SSVHSKVTAAHHAVSKVCTRDRGDAIAHVRVGKSHPCVGEERMPPANSQRPYKTSAEEAAMENVKADKGKAVETESKPRTEGIKRPHRQPANRTEAHSESKSAAPSKKAHVSRSPDRPIPRIHRSRPPYPAGIPIEPAAVVIRRPAPGLVGNPGP